MKSRSPIRPPAPPSAQRPGRSVLEIVLVAGMLLLITILLLNFVLVARERARQTHGRDRLRAIGTGFRLYHDTWQRFPQSR